MIEKFYYTNILFRWSENGIDSYKPYSDTPFKINYINNELIEKFFSGASDMLQMKASGASGIILYNDDHWFTYGWFQPPEISKYPFQLPIRWRKSKTYWIFNCRTNSQFRGNGWYTLLLYHMIMILTKIGKKSYPILIDTGDKNIGALKAIKKIGFVQIGKSRLVRIPVINLIFEMDKINDI